MRIGVDIDGVLTDIERFIIDYGSKFCIENKLSLDLTKGIKYDESKTFNWRDEQTIEFWNKYIIHYFKNYPSRDFAKEVIKMLKEEGNEIYIVTARNEYGLPMEYKDEVKNITEQWLKEKEINYDKIIYTSGSKLPYCVGNYIEIMIEDSPQNISNLSPKIPVICFNNIYNENVQGENIIRAYSWYDVYNKINLMK